jgi:hypothetical protein
MRRRLLRRSQLRITRYPTNEIEGRRRHLLSDLMFDEAGLNTYEQAKDLGNHDNDGVIARPVRKLTG